MSKIRIVFFALLAAWTMAACSCSSPAAAQLDDCLALVNEGQAIDVPLGFRSPNGVYATPQDATFWVKDSETGVTLWGPYSCGDPELPACAPLMTITVGPAGQAISTTTKKQERHTLTGSFQHPSGCTPGSDCRWETGEMCYYVKNLELTVGGGGPGPTPAP